MAREFSQPASQPARTTNPAISFLHSTTMMSDESWEKALSNENFLAVCKLRMARRAIIGL